MLWNENEKNVVRTQLVATTEWSLVSARAMALSEFSAGLIIVRIGIHVICINEWKTASSCISINDERIPFSFSHDGAQATAKKKQTLLIEMLI